MERQRGLDEFTLKLLAAVTMVIDHIGVLFFPDVSLLRIIGRLSFPIFAFLVAEGFAHTHSFVKYLGRMVLLAVVTEIPFDLLRDSVWNMQRQNVLLTFCVALLTLRLLEWGRQQGSSLAWGAVVMAAASGYAVGELLRVDYGGKGVLTVILFYLCRELRWGKIWMLPGMVVLHGLWGGDLVWTPDGLQIPLQIYAVASLMPIWLYNGQRGIGGQKLQWSFYLFYPVHLLVLEGISYFA